MKIKKSTRFICTILTFVMLFSVVPMMGMAAADEQLPVEDEMLLVEDEALLLEDEALPVEEESLELEYYAELLEEEVQDRGVPTLVWYENFEHNSSAQMSWSYRGGTRVPDANNRNNTIEQSIVPQGFGVGGVTPGPNSDPDSEFMGRFASVAGNNQRRQGRAVFDQPILTNGEANLTFDWFPGVPGGQRYGQLAVQSIDHFNSLNYLSFVNIPAGLPVAHAPAGYAPGLYFVVGTTRNVFIPDLGISVMPESPNFITANVNSWLTISIDFDFTARTMNLVITEAVTGAPVLAQLLQMADEPYVANQVTGLQFFGNSFAANSWNTYLDNVSVRVYDGLPTSINRIAHPFGMPQNVVYSPVTTDSVTVNWDNMEADGFYIYRRHATQARTALQRIATVTDGFSFEDTGLSGPYYYYRVAAFRNTENGEVEVSEMTREAFIVLAADQEDEYDDFTLISATDTTFAGFGNRLRLGDLDGDGRMDILLTNVLPQAGRNWAGGFPNAFPNAAGAPGVGTGGDGGSPRVIYSLTALDIEGNILWQRCALTNFRGFDGHSREISTGADEPVQIGRVTADVYNNVVLVANQGVPATEAWSAANPWINSVPPLLLANPEFIMPTNYVDRFYQVEGDVFYILDGRTGDPAVDVNGRPMEMTWTELIAINPDLPITNVHHLHDQITLANLDGRGVNAYGETVFLADDPTAEPLLQHVIVSHRYQRTTAFEMINHDGEFVMRFMWQYNAHPPGLGGGDTSPHYPLAAPMFRDQGDTRDWIYNNWELLHPETGVPMWRVPNGHRTFQPAGTWDPGILVARAAHMDSIWVADMFGTGEYVIVKGVDSDNMAVVAVTREGEVLFANFCPTEAQSANPAWFRTDAEGMMSVGLDRRHRGAYPQGHDGLFMLDSTGATVFTERSNFQGWMTTTWAMNNWNGTFSPLVFAFNRNLHAIEAVVGGHFPPSILEQNLPPAFYDGYFNPLFTLPELVGWEGLRWMQGNLMGDSRDEIVSFSDRAHLFVFANGVQDAFDGITGVPRRSTPLQSSWTRYNVGYFSTNFADREASTPHARVLSPTSVEITLIPVIFATGYTLYQNGVAIRTFNPDVDDLVHVVTGLSTDTIYEFSVTVSETTMANEVRTTRPSVPFVFNRQLGEVGFTAEHYFGANSSYIRITFDRPVTGLIAQNIVVQSFVGDRYAGFTTGELTGSGAVYYLEITEITRLGVLRVIIADFNSFFVTTNPVELYLVHRVVEFNGTSPGQLSRILEQGFVNVTLSTRGNLGIFTQHSPFVIPEGSILTVTTTLNVSGNAELVVEGTLVVAEGGRVNNQGGSGGTITLEGALVNNGWVENVTNSTFVNNGTIENNGRFEVRASATLNNYGDVEGTPLNINRNAIVTPPQGE
ncbi:MAG: hypothetical protein FWD05_02095 [Oscillospiraceae bacterium]|nr:hypothetical protein [Oscillospiraceae bacterium]